MRGPTPHGPAAYRFAQEADCSPFTSPCFSLGSGTSGIPYRVKAARGPSSIAARSASITKAHRALAVALTGGVNCAGWNRAARFFSSSHGVWWISQLWPQRQHLLYRRQWSLGSAARDVRQVFTQSQA
jgi:hypothetical protein